jgi:hypothetical protein
MGDGTRTHRPLADVVLEFCMAKPIHATFIALRIAMFAPEFIEPGVTM